jgi:TatD DNase family protein
MPSEPLLVDSHCHLDFPDFEGRLPELRAAMQANGVTHALCISTTIAGYPRVLEIASGYDNFWCSVGVHPDTEGEQEATQAELVALASHPKVVALGETGLDYFRLKGDLEWQRERFRRHIRAAREVGKPLIIHTRAAPDDTLRVMREEKASEAGGVLHCFTESLDMARAAIDMGFHISFSGIVTFKNAKDLKEVARVLPLERILVETDSPYLAPVPHRGKVNQPALVKHVAEEVARLRGQSFEEIARATSENFFRLFRIAPGGVVTA